MIPEVLQQKIWSRDEAASRAAQLRAEGKRIVFTNGVFDILHAGHVSYLADAAALGDFLILGLNSDDSVRRLGKSPARPLQSEKSRALVIAALQSIGAVIIFDEDTPAALISEINPHVLVKGADYAVAQIAGADVVLANGGQVLTIPLLQGYSTTSIEQKILRENKS
jgi:D-glycero-beta-D-manno-heptose 1-phosphate adenylyltransferase